MPVIGLGPHCSRPSCLAPIWDGGECWAHASESRAARWLGISEGNRPGAVSQCPVLDARSPEFGRELNEWRAEG